MRAIFASVTAVCLAAHLLLGCCAHHAHESAASEGLAEACTSECEHTHDDGSSDHSHDSGGPSHCKGASCVFLTQDSKRSVSCASETWVMLAVLPSLPTTFQPVLAPDVTASSGDPPSSALRLHLLNRVLLI